MTSDLVEKARGIRDIAKRARRLSEGASTPEKEPLLLLAEELEGRAIEMEKREATQLAAVASVSSRKDCSA